jgi:hypothetical protein
LVGYPWTQNDSCHVLFTHFTGFRRCTSSVQCWSVLPKPLISTNECIIGAAAADILGDVGISSPGVRTYLMEQTGFLCMPPPHPYLHLSLVPPSFNTTSTPCSRSMPHNSHPTKPHPALALKIPRLHMYGISQKHGRGRWVA